MSAINEAEVRPLLDMQPGEEFDAAVLRVARERRECLAFIGQAWDAMPEQYGGESLAESIRLLVADLAKERGTASRQYSLLESIGESIKNNREQPR